MNFFPEHIRLNGHKIHVMDFIKKNHSAEHEKQLAGFLAEWYAPGDSVEVQTSGSTGPPKKIVLKKEFIARSAMRTIKFFNLKEDDRILLCLPMKFIAGKLMVVRALLGNLHLYMADPSTDFSFLTNEKFTFAAMVPLQVQKVLDAEPSSGTWINNLEQLLIGGSAIPFLLETQLKKISAACYSSYGMTETATHIALRKLNGDGADEFYHCLEEIKVQLSDEECLQIFMPGLTEYPLTTTDLAELKNGETFKIKGRADNVIISGGIKYSPEQLEKKLEPFITIPFLISSLPHDSLGQQLVLVVEEKESSDKRNKLTEICRKQLGRYEQPRQIIFKTKLFRLSGGKPDRLNF
jgi:o-succinylbenzoate---CoA ligase